MPKHTPFTRYIKLMLAFLLSRLLHLLTEVAAHGGGGPSSNLSFHESQCVRFFVTQAIGIMFEDGVQEIAKRFRDSARWQCSVVDESCGMDLGGRVFRMDDACAYVSCCKTEHRGRKGRPVAL
jgi:hypothetical protein